MGEVGQLGAPRQRAVWRGRALIALGIFCGLLLIFHRPLLLGLGRRIALHYAAKENLKLQFRLEGSVFTNLTIRNLHAVPTGPSDVESIDVDLARIDYGLFALLRHGISTAVKSLDARAVRIVINPAKATLRPRPPNPKKKIELPPLFAERVHIADATIVVRNRPHDFVAEHVDVDLDPRHPSDVKVGKLQLVGGQTWLRLAGQATYVDRNLVLYNIVLAEDERFRAINFNASQIAARRLGINLEYEAEEGSFSGSLSLQEARGSLETTVRIHAANLPVDKINKFVALPEDWMRGELKLLDVDLSGILSSPITWNGSVFAELSGFRQGAVAFDHGVFQVTAKNGIATLESADITQDQNQFHLRGSAELPRDIRDLGRAPATGELAAALPDLKPVTAGMPQRLSGSAQLNGKIDIKNGKLEANLNASAGSIGFADGRIDKLSATLRATKVLPAGNTKPGSATPATAATPATERRAWFADLRSAVDFHASNVHYRDLVIDSAEGSFVGVNEIVNIERLDLHRNQNDLNLRGRYSLPENIRMAASQDAELNLSLNAPELSDYWTSDSPDKIAGPLQMSAQIERKHGISNGQVTIFGSNLIARLPSPYPLGAPPGRDPGADAKAPVRGRSDLVIKQLSAQCSISNNVVYLNDFTASLNERDFVGAHGIVDLSAPYHYSGKLSANISDLSRLEPLLRASGNENELAGSVVIDWEGSGDAAKFKNTGKLKFTLDNGRYGTAHSLRANADATYTPDGLDIPTVFVASSKMDFQAIMQAKGETLEISKVQLDQGEAKYASGYISIPFVWKNLGTNAPVFPPNGKVTATFQSEKVDIKKLFQDIGLKPTASGTVNVKLDAQGTLGDLDARLDVQMRDLRSEHLPNFDPAAVDLSVQSQHNRLTAFGKLQQSKIQPLEATANLPFDVAKILRDGKLADDTPITAKIRLPRSPVNFVRQLVPEIQELDGDVALDVDVLGTVAQPFFNGTGDMTVNVARSKNTTFPALKDFKARLNFAQDTLSIEKFSGDLSGGRFALSGHATFPKLTSANLDLHLKADSALITRNDTLTARADADIKITGPLQSANVTGTVAMTNSQFLKNLDLIPIGLPGRPAPQPPSARPEFSFPDPPLRDWKFDVKIKTKDPVLIRGSLANGGAVSDLHLTGTGLHPALEGIVRLENVEATLPFSRLEVSSGSVYFDPSDSFNPRLDLHGTSVIHDHTIHVYIYGTSLAPEALFTSEPPLPQEEIISLLATGTTREELTASNNVLAGRAAMLLGQQLYRKIFKKGQPTQTNSVFERLDVDAGTVDPRTGQQQATARFKINDQFIVVGDIGVGGDYRGMLKYLIRFR